MLRKGVASCRAVLMMIRTSSIKIMYCMIMASLSIKMHTNIAW